MVILRRGPCDGKKTELTSATEASPDDEMSDDLRLRTFLLLLALGRSPTLSITAQFG